MPTDLETQGLKAWRPSLDLWGYGIDLVEPQALTRSEDIAFIDLRDRQTWVNYEKIESLQIQASLGALYAHEIGHHVRYPHTLVRSARLLRRQRALLEEWLLKKLTPKERKSTQAAHLDFLLNIFLDLLINDQMWREWKLDFVSVYKALVGQGSTGVIYAYYMGVYEQMWGLSSGTLVSEEMEKALRRASVSWREWATRLGDRLREESNLFVQLYLFLESFWPFVVEEVKTRPQHPPLLEELLSRAVADMNAAEVIESSGDSDEEREAEDWLKRRRESERPVPGPPKQPPARPSTPSRRSLGQALNTARSLCGKDKVSEVILLFYERLVQREEIEAEKVSQTDKISPSTVSLWEVGEDLPKLDWTSSLLRSGVVIPGVTAVTRDWEEETRGQENLAVPWIEIYIDSSGSMPDPTLDFSPLAFAGFLLAKSAVQAGSKVRIIQYSGCKQVQAMKDFTSSLRAAFPALLKYFGDGTDFPFPVLEDSVNRFRGRAPVARVFITDSDFLMNVQRSSYKVDPFACLEEACRESTRVMAILNLGSIREIQGLPRLLATGLQVVSISDWAELTGVAIRISEGLFPKTG